MTNSHTRVLLVDDHVMMRKGMVLLLKGEPDIEVIGEAGDGEEAIKQVSSLNPDIVMMGLDTPRLNSVEATRQIAANFPKSKIIAFSKHSSKDFVDNMLSAGASGYLLKESSPEELLQGIRAVTQGEMCLSKAVIGTIIDIYVKEISNKQSDNKPIKDFAVLQTKLHQPPSMPDLVPRMRLVDHLDGGQLQPLILISAPAGYGKSTLVSNWLETCGWPSGWISLEQSDSDISQFLIYFVAALRKIFPNICEQTLIMANAPQLQSISSLAATLSNELGKIEQHFLLVLDDYYRIDAKSQVHDLLYHLLKHPLLSMHLVIVTRRDPPLQLATLRAQGQVTEVRMQDLCFTREETKALLESAAAFTADDNILNDLEKEIEGWAVGLRLVSQILSSDYNHKDFLHNLHSRILQPEVYLLEEVFIRQTPELQQFLLQSAILNRFCVPLCETVCQINTGNMQPEMNAQSFIDELTESSLFTVSLDSQNEWFRFHHLFQQLLQHELVKRMTSYEIARLHARAGQWFNHRGFIEEAIQHLLKAGDTIGAAEIIEQRHWGSKQSNKDRWQVVQRWLSLLPTEIKKQRPLLLLSQAWVKQERHQLTEMAPFVRQLESMAMEKPLDNNCMGTLKLFQSQLHYWAGKAEDSLQLLLEAQKIISDTHTRVIGIIAIYISISRQMLGQESPTLAETEKKVECHKQLDKTVFNRIICGYSFSHMLSGELVPAAEKASRIDLLYQNDNTALQGWKSYVMGASAFRLNRMQATLEHFSSSINDRHNTNARLAIDSMIGLALTHQAMQQANEATAIIKQLLHFARETNQLQLLIVAESAQARMALVQGDMDLAVDWLQSFDEKPFAPSMFFWLENSSITQARVLLAIASPESLEQANNLLIFLQKETKALHNTCQLIEIMVLQVLALEKLGHSAEALTTLEQVITLTEPGGWIRPFVESGHPMANILKRYAIQTNPSNYLRLILDNCRANTAQSVNITSNRSGATPGRDTWSNEALTNRERDIMELLTLRLQNKEIAAQLSVSVETIKSHLKNLYQKLGVKNRREAANLAKDIISSNSSNNSSTTNMLC